MLRGISNHEGPDASCPSGILQDAAQEIAN